MEARELRIGNLVGHQRGLDITFVIERDMFQYNSGLTNLEDFKPITLTDEWLFRFGFENGNSQSSNCDLWDKHWIGGFEIDKLRDGYTFYYGSWIDCKFKYVHQLQNLYFALTGLELTLPSPQQQHD